MSEWMNKYQWECFCDSGYFDKWAVRPIGETKFGAAFHVNTKEEAEDLVRLLSRHTVKSDNTQALHNALDRIKELEALAQKLVDAMKDAHPYVEDDAKRAGIGNMIVEAAKLGIK